MEDSTFSEVNDRLVGARPQSEVVSGSSVVIREELDSGWSNPPPEQPKDDTAEPNTLDEEEQHAKMLRVERRRLEAAQLAQEAERVEAETAKLSLDRARLRIEAQQLQLEGSRLARQLMDLQHSDFVSDKADLALRSEAGRPAEMNQDEFEEVLATVLDIDTKAAKIGNTSKPTSPDTSRVWSEGERLNENNEAMEKLRRELDKWNGPELYRGSRERQNKRDELVEALQRAIKVHGVEGTKSRLEALSGRNQYLDWSPLARSDNRSRADQGSKGRLQRLPALLLSGVIFGSIYWAWRRGHIARCIGRIAEFIQSRFEKPDGDDDDDDLDTCSANLNGNGYSNGHTGNDIPLRKKPESASRPGSLTSTESDQPGPFANGFSHALDTRNTSPDATLVTSGPVAPNHTITIQEIGPRPIKKSDSQPALGLDNGLDGNEIG